MTDTTAQCKRVEIYGRVQGVWYRGSAQQQAQRLGLAGWVSNRADGSVEALLQGEEKAIKAMLDWCWQGPPAAQVQRVVATDHPLQTGMAPGFECRY